MKTMKQFKSLVVRFTILAALLASLFAFSSGAAFAAGEAGAVYTLTNAASGNAVVAYSRGSDGSLSPAGSFPTGGLGSGAGLGSEGSLAVSQNGRWLFAVNAGSNDISSFSVQPGGLALVDRVPSGGSLPVSLTVHAGLLYVLNAGGSGNISGFQIDDQGSLQPLAGSARPLSNGGAGAAPGPAQVSFDPQGGILVVTEKATNLIDTYQVGENGLASGPQVNASVGLTPFGFDFGKRGALIVSEAATGALSSYRVDGVAFQVITPSATTHQTAACWVVVTKDGKYAYTTNAGSGSISGFGVDQDGSLRLLTADGRTGVTGDGSHPTDMALSNNSQFLYTLDNGSNRISVFAVNADGSLTPLPGADAPVGAVGLAAW